MLHSHDLTCIHDRSTEWQSALTWTLQNEDQDHGRPPDDGVTTAAKRRKTHASAPSDVHEDHIMAEGCSEAPTGADDNMSIEEFDAATTVLQPSTPTSKAVEPATWAAPHLTVHRATVSLTRASVDASRLTPRSQLTPGLRYLAELLAPDEGLVECGSQGTCCPSSMALQLNILDLHQGGGLALRAKVVDHAQKLADSDVTVIEASTGERPLRMRAFLLASLLSSPAFDDVDVETLSHDTWLSLMRRPSVYADEAFMAIAADCFQVEVCFTAIGLTADAQQRSTGSYRPLQGRQPRAQVQLVIWANVHMVARVAIRDVQRTPPARATNVRSPPPIRPPTLLPASTEAYVDVSAERCAKRPKAPATQTHAGQLDESAESLADLSKAIEASLEPQQSVTEQELVQRAMSNSISDATPRRMSRKELRAATWQARMNSVLAAGTEAVARNRRIANDTASASERPPPRAT